MDQNKISYNNSKTVDYYLSLNKFSLFDYERKIIDLFFNKNEVLLDIGCGTGRTTVELFNLGFNIIGIDFSEAMIKKAKENFPKIDFRSGNILDLKSFPKNHFGNVLFSFNGFSLLKFSEWKTALLEVCRIMKKDGIFFFTTPYLDNKIKYKYWKEKIKKNKYDIMSFNDRIKLGCDVVDEEGINFCIQIPFIMDIQNVLIETGYKIIFMGSRLNFFKKDKCEEIMDDNYLWVLQK